MNGFKRDSGITSGQLPRNVQPRGSDRLRLSMEDPRGNRCLGPGLKTWLFAGPKYIELEPLGSETRLAPHLRPNANPAFGVSLVREAALTWFKSPGVTQQPGSWLPFSGWLKGNQKE